MLDVTLNITLTLRGPILTKSTSAGSFGIDAAFAKDEGGRFAIPRGMIKGKLSQSFEELTEMGIFPDRYWEALLGVSSENARPKRGTLDISSFVLMGDRAVDDPRYRIRIDEDRGASDDGAYQVIESIARSGEEVNFAGTIRFYARDEGESDRITALVKQGFSFITSIGADKSTGFGELVGLDVVQEKAELTSARDVNDPGMASDRLQVRLKPRSLFCIARPGKSDNSFESDTVISGGIIKGCIASTWLAFWGLSDDVVRAGIEPSEPSSQTYPELCRNFEKLRFTSAFPSKEKTTRPIVIPYSVVADGNDELKDVADWERADLINGRSPAFQIDWKSVPWTKASEKFGWERPKTVLEVRNQHDRSHRKAKDENLFSYEMVNPHEHYWLGEVDFSRVPASERSATIGQLRHLLDSVKELRFLGKTKSRAAVEIGENLFNDKIPSEPGDVNKYIVTLQSPALLCDPIEIADGAGQEELRKAYEKVWLEMSGGTLRMVNYFAGQHLVGGKYLWNLFIQKRSRYYNPILLTNAGSVFVLEDTGKTSDRGAADFVQKWSKYGLELPNWAVERLGSSWETNPFIHENGFGEVRVNLVSHSEMKVVGDRDGRC